MKHILLSSILIIVVAIPLGALAQTRDPNTVGGLRDAYERLPNQDFIWNNFAFAVMRGAAGAGMDCVAPAGAPPRFVVGELMAHLRYAAIPTDDLVAAIGKYLISRGCRHPLAAGACDQVRIGAWGVGWSEGYSDSRKWLAEELLLIRTTEDHAALEQHVRRANEPGADPVAQVAGVVAGARLLELSRGGLRPTQKSVPPTQ